jgi:type III restriction enzyme
MRPEVNAISGRLSLRKPQREGLEILDRVMEIAPPDKDADLGTLLEAIRSEYPHVEDFERDFPSLCFALATGVGKTRLMGAFISYLHTAHGIDNFFVLAPNLTIYNKLIADFTPGTPKYVFKGVSAFATNPPDVVTGDNYESYSGRLFDALIKVRINIFNISKINSEVRGGKAPRIKRLSEYIGESYFAWLSRLPDLVLLMDESHRYRASAGVRAINELNPILGLELTATPYVTSGTRTTPFQNVIQDYSLRRAMEDGFVKEPAVVTRQNFSSSGMSAVQLELMKLEDGVRLHEQTKVELETYARNHGQPRVKPFMLVIARDTTHAAELQDLIKSKSFFEGRYADKVIQVDSSGSGAEKDETIERLLKVEDANEPTEIVIHVNMLKEGWDVTNLYTIVPLRAANAKVLIEQTIGRGLRLPYGKRTGVAEVDRLSIVAHDKFQEIVDEANRSDSIVQMQQIVLTDHDLKRKEQVHVIQPTIEAKLGFGTRDMTESTTLTGESVAPLYTNDAEKAAAKMAYEAIQQLQRNPTLVPDVSYVNHPDVQERLVREVTAAYRVGQLGMEGIAPEVDVARVVSDVSDAVVDLMISIPKITVVPMGDLRSWFEQFDLDLSAFNFPPVDDNLWSQELRTGRGVRIGTTGVSFRENRPEDYVISGLVDFDEISYDDHAELLQDLATQVVEHLRSYLDDEEQVEGVLQVHQKTIARSVFSQMMPHYREDASGGFETRIVAGFTPIKEAAAKGTGAIVNFRNAPATMAELQKTVYGRFQRCLQTAMKFDSNQERLLAIILDRESEKWFRPAAGQFQISYRHGIEEAGYHPDFVAETADTILMLEPKRVSEMDDPVVLAKRDAAVAWCQAASAHSASSGKNPWRYVLIPHDAIAENQTLDYLVSRFGVQ